MISNITVKAFSVFKCSLQLSTPSNPRDNPQSRLLTKVCRNWPSPAPNNTWFWISDWTQLELESRRWLLDAYLEFLSLKYKQYQKNYIKYDDKNSVSTALATCRWSELWGLTAIITRLLVLTSLFSFKEDLCSYQGS